MAKMKVHELAKELDKQSKEVLALLHENGVEVKSHMSSIEDSEIDMVKSKLGKGKPVSKASVEASATKEASASKNEAEHKAKKKKKIIFVSNPQNSNNSNRPSGNRPNNNRPNNNRPSGNRPTNRPAPEKETPTNSSYDARIRGFCGISIKKYTSTIRKKTCYKLC